ncbi:MAG: trypsin-like peptidase domain-containing protein [Planctomycetes bacterium]|nr:trypsin-like peptidase domain-containing protein [Planctomycetota bacterium]
MSGRPHRYRWILFEATKIVIVAAIASSIYLKATDAHYEAYASANRLTTFEGRSSAKISELEERGSSSLDELARARETIDKMAADLRQHEARFATSAAFNDQLASQTYALESTLRADLERIAGSAEITAQKVSERVSQIESQLDRSPKRLKQRLIYPVIQLRGNGTVGSGVVISSERRSENQPAVTYALTAFHVVQEITEGADDATWIREVKFMDPDTDRLGSIEGGARVVAFQPETDVAMLRMELPEPWPYIATLATPEELERVEIFDPVYAIGCPLGNKPLPTAGEISSQEKIVSGETFWMINAPTFFGNSGGGVFLAESGRLIGISSMIYTYGKTTPMVVPHMGLFVPLATVRQWLQGEGYAFLCDPEVGTPQAASGSAPDGNDLEH